jgi:hypothetical protein
MDPSASFKAKLVLGALQTLLLSTDPLQGLMPWFAQGVDMGNGILTLTQETPFSEAGKLHLNWESTKSAAVIDAIISMHKRLAAATGGTVLIPPTWTLFRDLITPHPLGGATWVKRPPRASLTKVVTCLVILGCMWLMVPLFHDRWE